MFGRKILNEAYPFNRGILTIKKDTTTGIVLPLLKLSAANMQVGDIYIISSFDEINLKNKDKINYIDYQLLESMDEFQEQWEIFRTTVQQVLTNETYFKFQITERFYLSNNQHINAIIISENE